MPPYLTKSRYTQGINCPRALWLTVNRAELAAAPDATLQTLFARGHEVGHLAQSLFPGGVELVYEDGLELLVERTAEAIAQGATTLYEATFRHNDVYIRADILHKGADGWELREVKSSTKVKDYHHHDLAVQYHVVTGAGLPLARALLVHIDRGYVRAGAVDPARLFAAQDLTAEVLARQEEVAANLARFHGLIREEAEPATAIGPQCFTPGECSYRPHCWSVVPSPSVFDLWPDGNGKALQLYNAGFTAIADLPDDRLTLAERRVRNCHASGAPHIGHKAIAAFLAGLRYPLAFLDFETTAMVAVPLFDGTRPYQAVPFQYSLHVREGAAAEPRHSEYIYTGSADPRPEFLARLLADLPAEGSILSWNMTFEKNILTGLANAFPEKAGTIAAVQARFVDLMALFWKKEIYFPAFRGSASLKAVLPTLCPDLAYDALEIRDGGMASEAWLALRTEPDPDQRAAFARALLAYCRLDTLAMVRILDWLVARV